MQGRQGKTAWAAAMEQSSLDKSWIGDALNLPLKRLNFKQIYSFHKVIFCFSLPIYDIIIYIEILDSLRASIL